MGHLPYKGKSLSLPFEDLVLAESLQAIESWRSLPLLDFARALAQMPALEILARQCFDSEMTADSAVEQRVRVGSFVHFLVSGNQFV